MIDWVSIVRHSRRRFSNYVGARAPIRIKKRRRTPNSTPIPPSSSNAHSLQEDRLQYNCCCTHVSNIMLCEVRICNILLGAISNHHLKLKKMEYFQKILLIELYFFVAFHIFSLPFSVEKKWK